MKTAALLILAALLAPVAFMAAHGSRRWAVSSTIGAALLLAALLATGRLWASW